MNHGSNDELCVGLPGRPEAVRTARRAAQAACQQWGTARETAAVVVTVVAEFAGNAVTHAGGAFRLVVRRQPRRIRVEVEDPLTCPPPRAGHRPSDAEHGRGLLIVERLTRSWGCEPLPHGKRMWAVVDA